MSVGYATGVDKTAKNAVWGNEMETDITRKKKWQYFLTYTVLFLLISGVMTLVFQGEDRSFVWSKDGQVQHYPTLVYVHRFLTELVGNLLNGKLVFPMVDFSIGEGMDVLTTLNYYGFGDPLTLTSLFCPQEHLELLYGILIFVRLYLSGIFFALFCFGKNQKQRVAVLAGALVYVFCGYALFASVRHPFFVNGMMYLPLYLLGIERILQKKRYGLFSAVVTLSLISNFYFGYMNTVMMGLYVLFSLVPERKLTWRKKVVCMLKMMGSYLCGVAWSAAVMLPMVMAYLNCSRGEEGGYKDSLLMYPKEFYQKFFHGYASLDTYIGGWTNLGFSILCLVAVICLFLHRARNKEERLHLRKLRLGYLLLTIMMLVPLAGKVMNGFGYVSNRWNYAYAMLNAYILVCMIPIIIHYLGIIRWSRLFLFWRKRHSHKTLSRSDFFRRTWKGNRFRISLAICLFITGNLVFNVVQMYVNSDIDYLGEFNRIGEVQERIQDSPVRALSALESPKNQFYRVEQPWITGNQSLIMGYYGHNWYFSIAPFWYFDFYNNLQLNTLERTYSLRGLDGRTVLNGLTATKYYTTNRRDDGLVPYGYSLDKKVPEEKKSTEESREDTGTEKKSEEEDGVNFVYKNNNFLPLGYTASGWITQEDYQLLPPIEKQEALLQTVVLSEEDAQKLKLMPVDTDRLTMEVKQEFCKVSSCSGLTWERNQLYVREENASITLTFQGQENSETYLSLNEFQVIRSGKWYQTGTVESDNTINHFVLINPEKSSWYDKPNQTINLGYSKEPKTSCTLTFPNKGVYSLDDFMVIYESMSGYEAKIDALRSDSLQNVVVETNGITGDITLSKTKLLQMAVPYSDGWKAYVNGEEVEILRSNEMYMALELQEGDSHVEFRYVTPYLREGIYISLFSVILWIVMCCGWRYSHLRKHQKQ